MTWEFDSLIRFTSKMFVEPINAAGIRRVLQQAIVPIRSARARQGLNFKPLLVSLCVVTLTVTTCASSKGEVKVDEYVGESNKAGQRHGEGVYNYPDGSTYIGNCELDKRAGGGTLYLTNGEVHDGHWYEDELTYGIIRYPDGSEYWGNLKSGKPNGLGRKVGKMYRYYGQFKDGKYDGRGELKVYDIRWWKFDSKEYEGQFKDGMRHGVVLTRNMEGVVVSMDIWENDKPMKKTGA